MNLILGSQYVVLASAGQKTSLTEWRSVADMLNIAAEKLEPAGLKAGYHNHQLEFTPVEGSVPSKTWPNILSHPSCCQSTWEHVWRRAPNRVPGCRATP